MSPKKTSEFLDEGYRAMALDEERECEALDWAESTIGDVAHESRS